MAQSREFLTQILQAGPVVLLAGAARCGKTTAAIDFHQDCRSRGRRCVLVAPNWASARRLSRLLLDRSASGVVAGTDVITFAQLAQRIIPAGAATRRLTPPQRILLLRQLVSRLAGEGKLPSLAAVADTPGLVTGLDKTIAELKRSAIAPDDLLAASHGGPPKWRDLATVYQAYQQHLLATNTYDAEGLVWQARQTLADLPADAPLTGKLAGVDAIAADGFTDFTPTQLAILELMSNRLEKLLITLPLADDGRGRMWHWTQRVADQLARRFGDRLHRIDIEPMDGPLDALAESAFTPEATFQWPDTAQLVGAAGPEAEVDAACRRAKRLLVEGEPPGSIAITARNLEPYRPLLERALHRHDIPASLPTQPLLDVPIIRMLLLAARIGVDFAYAGVLATIRSSYFRPAALGDYNGRTVLAAEQLIRRGNVLNGRESYAQAVERLAFQAETRRDALDESPDGDEAALPSIEPAAEDIRQAGEMLDRLFDAVSAADSPGGLLALIRALDLPAAALASGQAELIARDLRALAAIEGALGSLDDSPIDLDELELALSTLRLDGDRGEQLVEVVDLLDMRALRYRHVIVLGVNEGNMPQRPGDSALLGQAERAAWAARGLSIDSRSDLLAREMLLFYLALSRADGSLTLSWLNSDATGRAMAPSPFLAPLIEGGGDKARQAIRTIQPSELIPPLGEIASVSDAFNAAVASTMEPDVFAVPGPMSRPLRSWASAQRPQAWQLCARGTWARHRRWQRGQCDRHDGRLDHPAVLAAIARRFPGRTVFSASMLNTYAQCPWMFFGRYVLGLREVIEPQRQLEAVDRGTFIHAVLFRMLRGLHNGEPLALAGLNDEELRAALDQAIAVEAAQVERRPLAAPALWQVQLAQMRQAIWDYLLAQRQLAIDPEASHFELAFGIDRDAPDSIDQASQSQSVEVDTPAGPIRIRGKIDRVDRVRYDGEAGLLLVDYKTGKPPSAAELADARHVQMPLYIHAARAMMPDMDCLGGVFHAVGSRHNDRYYGRLDYRRGSFRLDDDFDEKLDRATEQVGRYVAGMAAGRFDLLPTGKCPSWCEFGRICHFSPARHRVRTGTGAPGGDDCTSRGARR